MQSLSVTLFRLSLAMAVTFLMMFSAHHQPSCFLGCAKGWICGEEANKKLEMGIMFVN